jgi:kinesin family protein 2/24
LAVAGNKLFDLLNDKKPLVARQNSKQQVCVVGLKERLVSNADELLGLISAFNTAPHHPFG